MKRFIYNLHLVVLGLCASAFSEVLNAQTCGFQTTCVPPQNAANGSWQMFYGSQKHTGVQVMKGNFSSGRSVRWTYTTGNWVVSSPAIGDINGDGMIEVIVGSLDSTVYALRATDGSLIWSYTTNGAVYSSPAIGDINGDGMIEVVVGSWDNNVYALRGTNGALLWSYTTGVPVYSSPVIGDINGDGMIEVVIGSTDFNVYALRGTNGSLIWSYTTGSRVISSPAIGDINGDGQIEVVIGSMDSTVYALRGTNGSLIWSYTTNGAVYSSPAIGDINGDGMIEVIVGSGDNNIYALRGVNGNLLWSYTTGSWVHSSPAIGDINGDGQIEVIIGSGDNNIYALRGTNGSLLWSYNIGSFYNFTEDVVLADIDPTTGIEIITHGRNTPTYVLSSSGTLIWSMSPVVNQRSLSVGNVDGEDCVRIVAVGEGSPMVGVIDAASNAGGCGYTDVEEVAKALNPDGYVEVYGVDGKLVYRGKYKEFKGKGGVYFVKEGNRVRKVIFTLRIRI